MSWSKRGRGSEARSRMKTAMTAKVLMKNQTIGGSQRSLPAAEVEDHRQRRDQGHPEVLADKEHAELHPRVLGVVAGDQLGLGLGQIERHPLGLGDPGDDEDQQAEELRHAVPQTRTGPRRCPISRKEPVSTTTPMRLIPMKTS